MSLIGGVASEVSRFVVSGGPSMRTTPSGQCDSSVVPRPWAVDVEREGTPRASTHPRRGATTRLDTPTFRRQVAKRPGHRARRVSAAKPPMIYPVTSRRRADPVRLCVARPLGHDIDGAWWPRADRIANELPHLVVTLTPLLGHITSINGADEVVNHEERCADRGNRRSRRRWITGVREVNGGGGDAIARRSRRRRER